MIPFEVRLAERLRLAKLLPDVDPPQTTNAESERRRQYRERYWMLPEDVRLSILGYACGFCLREEDLTIDHLVPPTLGGTDHDSNLWTLCRSCNTKKGSRTIAQWRAKLIADCTAALAAFERSHA